MVASKILIWNKEVGFVRINEGNGDNLLPADSREGYVDYIMMDFMEFDGLELVETDGAQVMLYELYQEKFKTEKDVVRHLINTGFIPDVEYTFLCPTVEKINVPIVVYKNTVIPLKENDDNLIIVKVSEECIKRYVSEVCKENYDEWILWYTAYNTVGLFHFIVMNGYEYILEECQ